VYGHLYPGDMDRYADRLDTAADEASKSRWDLAESGEWGVGSV